MKRIGLNFLRIEYPLVLDGASYSKPGLMTVSDKNKLDSIATGANKYIHPTTSGNKHIPAGGTSGNILRWGSDGTAVWGKEVMSESDKKKLEQVKIIVSFSHTFENLTDDIKAEFKKVNFSDIDVSSDEGLMYVLIAHGLAYGDDQSINTNDQIFIGNKSCLVNGSYIEEGTKTTATLELSYIHNPGKLRTTIMTGTILARLRKAGTMSIIYLTILPRSQAQNQRRIS